MQKKQPSPKIQPLTLKQLESLAEFRYRVRLFLRFAESQARKHGIHPQQYQLMLAVKGFGSGKPTITALAEKLQLAHHSTVELVDRVAKKGLAIRGRDDEDGRVVLVRLTAKGERIVSDIAAANAGKLQVEGRAAIAALRAVLESQSDFAGGSGKRPRREKGMGAAQGA